MILKTIFLFSPVENDIDRYDRLNFFDNGFTIREKEKGTEILGSDRDL